MKKVQVLLGVAVLAASFTSCKSEDEKMAEKSFDRYEKYVDSVNTVTEAEALANWQAIEAGFNDRMNEVDMAVVNMKDEADAKMRIEKAKILLKDSNLPIYNIAALTGYYNEFHFSTAFKRSDKSSAR